MDNNINFLKPFPKFCCTIGYIPTSYKVSLTYEEQLMWLCDYLENTVIPTVNNNGKAVEELQELFTLLKEYVDNYFDNLDVQEEINNKLDEMAEDGTLAEIIAEYLTLNSLLIFNSVAEMKSAENIVNGSTCKTLGYYEIDDGGSAIYKVREKTEEDVENNGNIIFVQNDLIAEIVIDNSVNINQFGAKGDNSTDNTTAIQNCFDYAREKNIEVIIPSGIYLVSQLDGFAGMKLTGINKYKSILKSIANNTCETGLLRFLEGAIVRPLITNILLDGKKSNNSNIFNGLYFFTAERQTDSYANIKSVEIQNFTGNGLVFDGTASTYSIREARVDDVRCSSNNLYGFYINSSTDCMFLQNTSAFNIKSGFYVKGANHKFISCKAHTNGIGDETTIDYSRTPASAYVPTEDNEKNPSKTYFTRSGTGYDDDPYEFTIYTGAEFQPDVTYYECVKEYFKRYAGFEILATRCSFSTCESQDNYGDGAYVQGVGNSLVGFIGDNNGFLTAYGEGTSGTKISYASVGLEQIYDGIHIYGCNSVNANGIFNNFRRNDVGIQQRAGVGIVKSSIINVDIIASNQIDNYKIVDSGRTINVICNGQNAIYSYDITRLSVAENYSIYSASTNESTIKRIGNTVFLHLCIDGASGIPASGSDIDILTLPVGFRPMMHHCYNGMLSNNHGYSIAGNGTVNIYKNGKIGVRGNSDVSANSIIIDCVYEVTL